MSRREDEEMRRKFWQSMADQAGGEILNHALLRVMASEPEDLKDKWLLFFSTESSLYYKRFPSESAMARLLSMTPAKEKQEYPLEGLPWDRVRCKRKGGQGFLSRFFSSPSQIIVEWDDKARFVLEADKAGEVLFAGRTEDA
ncbi:MAG: hypothetical protein PQJ59_12455 [Spirochaetales bacterium]|nr:hypothetical protein [Spirochaetales bacterium]